MLFKLFQPSGLCQLVHLTGTANRHERSDICVSKALPRHEAQIVNWPKAKCEAVI